jgi:phosphatidylcholine synthase
VPSLPARPTDLSVCRLIHTLTVSGIIVGMLALLAVVDGAPRAAVLLLIVAQVIDGVDGPLARRFDISTVMPRYDGYILDVVIDYVTCVLVPVTFAWQFDLLPHNVAGGLTIAFVLTTSAMWFSRTDMMTDDHWFRGFPAAWNLVIPTLWLLQAPVEVTAVVLVGLSLLSMTDVEFAHPVQVVRRRTATIAFMVVWVGAIVGLTLDGPREPSLLTGAVLLVGPLWTATQTIGRLVSARSSLDTEPAPIS